MLLRPAFTLASFYKPIDVNGPAANHTRDNFGIRRASESFSTN